MRITVRGFNEIRPFTAALPPDGALQVEENSSVRDVLDGLGIPAELQTKLVLFRNGRPAAPATKLREADQLVLFRPMTGG